MDTRTGDIATLPHFRRTFPLMSEDEFDKRFRPIDVNALPALARKAFGLTGRTKIGRNSPCPCGSEKRFKRCCMNTAVGS